jgi:L-ascorbate peroxidase
MNVTADMPPNPPSSNMAALWIRAVFHDAGTYTASSKSGGADASLLAFMNVTENGGIKESIATRFTPNIKANISDADAIALAGLVTVTHCGGPQIPFNFGRIDNKRTPLSPLGLLPLATESFATIMTKMRRMGFNNEDVVSLVTGSHTMG